MTAIEIKEAINSGKHVFWKTPSYEVIKGINDWYIKCHLNNNLIGLTWNDNITLNGKESDFYIGQ